MMNIVERLHNLAEVLAGEQYSDLDGAAVAEAERCICRLESEMVGYDRMYTKFKADYEQRIAEMAAEKITEFARGKVAGLWEAEIEMRSVLENKRISLEHG